MSETNEVKELNLQETIGRTEDFVNKNRRSLGIIGGAVLLAVVGYLVYQKWYVAGKEKEASAQMFMAEEYFKNDSLKLAVNGDGNFPGFQEVIDEYGVSPSANLAHFYLGFSQLRMGKYEEAIETLKGYDGDDEITPSLALGGIGDAYMEMNNADEAISYYEKAAEEDANNFTSPIFLMKLGQALETKGDFKGAVDAYKKIKDQYPTTSEGQQVDKYIVRAESKVNGYNLKPDPKGSALIFSAMSKRKDLSAVAMTFPLRKGCA
jgi:tetratricopeptide (TPR) repeat protein